MVTCGTLIEYTLTWSLVALNESVVQNTVDVLTDSLGVGEQ